MKQNDWLILIAVVILLYFLTRRKLVEDVTSTFSFPGLNDNGTSKTRESGGDLLSYIISQQGDQIQNF